MSSIFSKIRKVNWFQILLGLYTILFIFTMVNREFVLFGLDLRYIELPVGGVLLLLSLILRKYKGGVDKNDAVGRAMILFYVFVLVASIAWLWNGLQMFQNQLMNEMILVVNICMGVFVFFLNRKRLNFYLINYAVVASCLVLVFSMAMVHQGHTLVEISGAQGAPYMYGSSALVSNNNIFGEDSRIAGYASDPNYATILLLIGVICTLKVIRKNWLKAILVAGFVLAMGLSFSRTIALIILPCAVYVWFTRKIKVKASVKMVLNRVIFIGIVAVVIIAPYALEGVWQELPVTLTQRFRMWRKAGDLFMISPLVGSGLTSFRSFFFVDDWYVQAHSTYWQVISEFGIIGMFLYYRMGIKALDNSTKNPLNYFLTLVFLIWIATCESIALPFSIFIYYLLSVEKPDKGKELKNGKKRRALFFVNSLKQGGAEKVCVSLANELVKEGAGVDFVLLNDDGAELVRQGGVGILNLKVLVKNRFLKVLRLLISVPIVNFWIKARIYDEGDYDLVTSHLPMSNLITRFSVLAHDTVYVFHTRIGVYKVGSEKFYQRMIRALFGNEKVVTVSEGLRNEYLKEYGAKTKLVRTIYNPVDVRAIEKKAKEKIDFKGKYILQVGRFDKAKRQDRMLEVFERSGLKEKYDLVFCGTGEGEESMKEKAKELGIDSHVRFMGYQENVYAWMARAEVVVSTSDYEAFPMNLVEAFASGAKVVAADCNYGPREILRGKYADFLVKPKNDVEQYAKKIRRAIESYPKEHNPILDECMPAVVAREYEGFYAE